MLCTILFLFSMHSHTTRSPEETRKLAQMFSQTLHGGDILLLYGNLGSGKTTFAQGILEKFGAKKPYTSPTFLIIKTYSLKPPSGNKNTKNSSFAVVPSIIHHIDAYRVNSPELLRLGWKEIINDANTLTIVEWPENISDILPRKALSVKLLHNKKHTRIISLPASIV